MVNSQIFLQFHVILFDFIQSSFTKFWLNSLFLFLLLFCFVVVVIVTDVVRLFDFSALVWTLFISLLFCHVHLLKLSRFKNNQPYSPSMRRLCFVSLSTYFSSTLFDHGQNSTQPHFTRSISQLRLSHQVQTGSTLFPKINTQRS